MMPNREKEALLSVEKLKEKFDYIPETGELVRKNKKGKVGWIDSSGHLAIEMHNKFYYAHRLIFFIHHGYFPSQIDHINRIKTDNRIENLRDCSPSANSLNRGKIQVVCHSIFKGVSWEKGKTNASKHWRAYVTVNGETKTYGYWETEEEAAKIRDIFAVKHNVHGLIDLNFPELLDAYSAICKSR
jgi:hypothetical protein